MVAQRLQGAHESTPGAALALRIWNEKLLVTRNALADAGHGAVQFHDAPGRRVTLRDQSAPLEDLLNILQADDPGALFAAPQLARPLDYHPREVANLFLSRLAASGLAVVAAVWRGVQPCHGLAVGVFDRVNLPNVRLVMHRMRVIGRVHADGGGVVVDGDGHLAAQAKLQASAGAATAGEQVNDDGVVILGQRQAILGIEVKRGRLRQ
ncbi:hypothetical protein D3C78_1267060 [compost metagenome]